MSLLIYAFANIDRMRHGGLISDIGIHIYIHIHVYIYIYMYTYKEYVNIYRYHHCPNLKGNAEGTYIDLLDVKCVDLL